MLVPADALPIWTLVPFGALVLGIAVLPAAVPHRWERHRFQALVAASCAAPIVGFLAVAGRGGDLQHAVRSYVSFIVVIGALFVISGGVRVTGNLEATPRNNALLLLAGSVLASLVGTTGATMLLVRPLLVANSERARKAHIIPFFLLTVSNAGGMLTPLGDPPLLVGYLSGVPFLWTLRLLPLWALYIASILAMFVVVDRRAHARETPAALALDRERRTPIGVEGGWNAALLAVVAVAAALLPWPWREVAAAGAAALSFLTTRAEVHRQNRFAFAPVVEVAILFAGLFVCLAPVEATLARVAPSLPISRPWQFFWATGMLSSVLDNAPTYAAMRAIAAGQGSALSDPTAVAGLVAGVEPLKLAALSAGAVVMGATTYIGNGPNLLVKALCERSRFDIPSFGAYAAFAFAAMLPAHAITTVVFVLLAG